MVESKPSLLAGLFGLLSFLPAASAGDGHGSIDGLDRKVASDISGLACGPERDGRRGCVVVVDEKRRVHFLTLRGTTFTLEGDMVVLDEDEIDPTTGEVLFENDEADLEAVARDGDVYWLFGSHSTKRKKGKPGEPCALQPGRRHLYRFAVDPKTERPSFATGSKTAAKEVRRIDRLPEVLRRLPELAGVVDATACAGEGGLDIEGGTVRGGRMTIGLRGPLGEPGPGGRPALLVDLDAEALVDGGDPKPRLRFVPLGGAGVRDLAAVDGGVLILSGPSGSDDAKPGAGSAASERSGRAVWFLPDGSEQAEEVHRLSGFAAGIKPEGLAVLDATATGWRVLIVSDGVAGGAPFAVDLDRPRRASLDR